MIEKTQSPILRVDDLRVAFGARKKWTEVIHGVSFDVHPGETVALVGESGSGKSVTAMSILGLLPPGQARIEGNITFEGREIPQLSPDEMRRLRGGDIAMIFQEPMTSLNPVMTCGNQIAESLAIHRGLDTRTARAETLRLFNRVRISDAERRFSDYPHNLSGGMRQRIMIAMALACKPKMLIADEPTTALDVTIQAQILSLVKELQEDEGMAVLFITHDMGVVAEVSDRTVVMRNGDLVETGTTANIFGAPKAGYTRSLLSAVPRLGSMAGESLPRKFQIYSRNSGEAEDIEGNETPARAPGAPLLKVQGLTTRFTLRQGILGRVAGRVHAVENVSFDIRSGETLALVGESGCGKSTTGQSVLRLTEPDAGTVDLNGENVLEMDKDKLRQARRRMQMIFQDPYSSLNPRRSVGNSIIEPMLVNGLATREEAHYKARELMTQVGLLPDALERYPHQFSGGQRQRICIARALSLEPDLIVADESVSALDVSVKAQVVNLMLDLQQRLGIAYLFISHDMAVVERVAHRVAVMYLGEIVEIGTREAVLGNPQHPYTKRLLSAVPVADPSRRHISRVIDEREIQSPIRQPDYVPPNRSYLEAAPGHIYLDADIS